MIDIKYLIEHIDILLSWKIAITGSIMSFSFLGLYFINDFFYDILKNMLNKIVISCIFFTVLLICKFGFQLRELITWKKSMEKENQLKLNEQFQIKQEILDTLRNLNRDEIIRIKYLWKKPSKIAYFPSNDIYVKLLEEKSIILCLGFQKYIETQDIHPNNTNKAIAFTINNDIVEIIKENKFITKWKQIKDENLFLQLNSYQE